MYAPRHQVKFLVRVNLPGDKPDSDAAAQDPLSGATNLWQKMSMKINPISAYLKKRSAVFVL